MQEEQGGRGDVSILNHVTVSYDCLLVWVSICHLQPASYNASFAVLKIFQSPRRNPDEGFGYFYQMTPDAVGSVCTYMQE